MHHYSTDQSRRNSRYVIMGAIALAIVLFFREVAEGTLLQGALSFAVVSTAIYVGFNRYAWRLSVLHKLGIVEVPDLNGTWSGYLYTSNNVAEIDDDLVVDDGRQIAGLTKMETEIEIEQHWDKIRVTLDGPESPSYSRGATLLVNEKAWPTITYNYLNEGTDTNDELDMHYGTATLQYDPDDDSLEGPYYTRPDQRGNHGRLELTRD